MHSSAELHVIGQGVSPGEQIYWLAEIAIQLAALREMLAEKTTTPA